MMAPAVLLTGLYAALALLLLSLHLKSAWAWPVKASATALALPSFVGAFVIIEAQTGWPSHASLPERFQLHAVLVDEPAPASDVDGAIFLWVTPWKDEPLETPDDPDRPILPAAVRPRAYDLPYSRELHEQVESMRETLARGEMVMGRHEAVDAADRRFGQQGGHIELDAPPPPPMPAKDG